MFTIKKKVCVDAINNAWVRLVFDDANPEIMDFHLGTLYQFISSEIRAEDFLEITFASNKKTIVGARKLVKETRKRKQEAIAQMNRLKYGTSRRK